MTKDEARSFALKKRKSIVYNQNEIFERLAPFLKNKKIVGLYYPLRDELNLLSLLDRYKDIEFVFPKVNGTEMEFRRGKLDSFAKGPFHLLEPTGEIVDKKDIDLIIVPLLAANNNNYRIGYGKGYYDRYLALYDKDTISIISHELVLDFSNTENDIRIKEVILL